MKTSTEEREAEAVLDGLTGMITCACGEPIPATAYTTYASCACGVNYRLFKKIGWKVSKRSQKAMKNLEKRLRTRIMKLEEQLAQR